MEWSQNKVPLVRRWFRFSLRMLFVSVTALALLFGYAHYLFTVRVSRSMAQQITPGQTMQEVEALMGAPDWKYSQRYGGGDRWGYYVDRMETATYVILFDERG